MTTNTTNKRLKYIFARHKVRFVRGLTDFGGILALVNLIVLVGVYWDKVVARSINPYFLVCGAVITVVFGFWIYGYWYERSRIWELETTHVLGETNKEWTDLCRDVRFIQSELHDMVKWQIEYEKNKVKKV